MLSYLERKLISLACSLLGKIKYFGKIKHGKQIAWVLRATLGPRLLEQHFTRPDIANTHTQVKYPYKTNLAQVSRFQCGTNVQVEARGESRVESRAGYNHKIWLPHQVDYPMLRDCLSHFLDNSVKGLFKLHRIWQGWFYYSLCGTKKYLVNNGHSTPARLPAQTHC